MALLQVLQSGTRFMTLQVHSLPGVHAKVVHVPRRADGSEHLCRPAEWLIQCAIDQKDPDAAVTEANAPEHLDALVGKDVSLRLTYGDDASLDRHLHGVITHAELHDHAKEYLQFAIEVRSRSWLLSLTRTSRVIQGKDALAIAKALFESVGLKVDASGLRPPKALEYVVQYDENHLDFATRILAESGLWWAEVNDSDSTRVVIGADTNQFCPVNGSRRTASLMPGDGCKAQPVTGKNEVVTALSMRRRMATAEVSVSRYSHAAPDMPQDGTARSDSPLCAGSARIDAHALPFGQPGNSDQAITASEAAQLHLARLTGDVRSWTGVSDIRALQPGCFIAISGAPGASASGAEIALLGVEHHAAQEVGNATQASGAASYRNEFTAIPAGSVWRVPVPLRPRVPGFITARVDGPDADIMKTAPLDDQGRYAVKLFLDHEQTDPGKGSLPVRMVQPYAGPPTARNNPAGFHAPLHVGTEVVLAHLDGDPDRPIIAGAVPNVPYHAPSVQANADHSAWRSVGANEIVLDDSKGAERLRLVAEKDHQTFVYHDEVRQIGNSQTTWIGFPVSAQDPAGPMANPLEAGVSKTHSAATPPGDGFGKLEFVMIGSAVVVGGFYQIAVGGAMNTTVGLAKTEQVGGFHHSTVLGYRTIEVGKDYSVSVKGEHSELAEKDRKIETKKNLVIDAGESITIRVGKSKITMDKSGVITIEGKELNIKTSGDTVIKAKNVKTN